MADLHVFEAMDSWWVSRYLDLKFGANTANTLFTERELL